MLRAIKNTVKKLRRTEADSGKSADILSQWADEAKVPLYVPPGHYYSPIPSLAEIRRDESRTFGEAPRGLAGMDLREDDQLRLLNDFLPFYAEMPFQSERSGRLRYYYENPAYAYSDAILLHCMIRHLKPGRIIEVGSGFSSCMILDTNELFFEGSIKTTFVEPYPNILLSLLRKEDRNGIQVIADRLQEVDPGVFRALRANDILFVDSTHVCKINSDVQRIFFEILPALAPGVHVHFHDIFYPFEYPKDWAFEGRAWNEAYLLRAFLQYNADWRIVLMNTFLHRFHADFFRQHMPLCLKNTGGSIWIRREG